MNKHIALGVLSGSILTVVNIVVNVFVVKLVLTGLDPKTAGIWFIFLNIGSYILFLDLGISPTVSREIGFIIGRGGADLKKREESVSDFVHTTSFFFKIIAAVVFVISVVLGIWGMTVGGYPNNICLAWFIFSAGAAINLLGGPAFSSLFGLGQVSAEKIIKSVTQVVWLTGAWFFLRLGSGIVGLSVAWTIQSVAARLLAWWYLYQSNPWLKGNGRFNAGILRSIAMPSLKWAAMGLGAILILQTDNIIIAYMMGPAVITRYEPVMKIVWVLMTFTLIFANTSVPFASRLYAASEAVAFNKLLMRNVRYCVGFVVMLVPFIGVYGDSMVYVWLGNGYFPGYPIVWVLLLMVMLEVHHVVHASAVMAAGHVIFLPAALVAGGVKIALSLALCSRFGLIGVPLGTFIAQLLTNNWYAPYKSKEIFGYSSRSYFFELVFPLSLAFIVNMCLVLVFRSYLPHILTLTTLIFCFFVYTLVVLAVFWFIVIPVDEKGKAKNFIKSYANSVFA